MREELDYWSNDFRLQLKKSQNWIKPKKLTIRGGYHAATLFSKSKRYVFYLHGSWLTLSFSTT